MEMKSAVICTGTGTCGSSVVVSCECVIVWEWYCCVFVFYFAIRTWCMYAYAASVGMCCGILSYGIFIGYVHKGFSRSCVLVYSSLIEGHYYKVLLQSLFNVR